MAGRRAWMTVGLLLGLFVLVVAVVQLGPHPPAPYSGPPYTVISGFVSAGPTCPVVQNPQASACAPQPVAGATLELQGAGLETQRTTSELDGHYLFRIPAMDGTLTLTALPLQGLRPPAPMTLTLRPDQSRLRADFAYDTGIR